MAKPTEPEPTAPSKCPTCRGQGNVDSKHGQPWTRNDPEHKRSVVLGEVMPKICIPCEGTGMINRPKIAQPQTEE